jgi:hypothetical protein
MSATVVRVLLLLGVVSLAASCSPELPDEAEQPSLTHQALATPGTIKGLAGKCMEVRAGGTANGAAVQLYDCNGSSAQQWASENNTLKTPGGKCLDVQWGSTANGALLQIYDCNGTAAQGWRFEGGTLKGLGGKCVDVPGGNSANGTQLTMWDCHGGSNQQWAFEPSSRTGVVRGLARKCVDVRGGSTASGTPVQLYDCNGTGAQAWTLQGTELRGVGGKCLDVRGGSTADGAPVQLWDCNRSAAQQWRFEGTALKGPGGKCLDVPGANSANGTQLSIWSCHGGSNQQWALEAGAPGGGSTPPAHAFLQGLTFGINVERGRAWYLSDFGSGTQGYTYFRNMGITHVRLFYPWRPSQNMGGSAGVDVAPTRAEFERILDSAANANRAGLKVFIDLLDVMGSEDFAGGREAMVDAYVRMATTAFKERNFDPRMAAVGPVNEWAGGDGGNAWADGNNPTYNGHRARLMRIMRGILPNHTLIDGPSYWKHYEQLMKADFQRTGDANVVYDVHSYDWNSYDGAHWADVSSRVKAWQQANGNPAVIWGESGFGWGNEQDVGSWLTPMDHFAQYLMPFRPTLWAVTDGNAFRMNPDPSSHVLHWQLEERIRFHLGR